MDMFRISGGRSGSLLLLFAMTAWCTPLVPQRVALPPLFYVEPDCSGAESLALWSTDLRGCFAADSITLESSRVRVEITFPGSSRAQPRPLRPHAARLSFLRGEDPSQWRTGETYASLRYTGLYPGIDLVYGEDQGRLKSEFYVAPGANGEGIRIRYSGATRLDAKGDLLVDTERGTMREQAPFAYQPGRNGWDAVEVAFTIGSDGVVGFRLGVYDRDRPLVIDPTLSFSTVFGGGGSRINAVVTDAAGNAYFAGCTDTSLSQIKNAYQTFGNGRTDAFAGKFGPAGNLIYATYLGGSLAGCATGIAVDSTGAATITGWTTATDFPIVSAAQSKAAGGRDAFVARLSTAGNSLIFSTYLGGALQDNANGVAIDGSGNIYVAGETQSANFPLRNATQAWLRGGMDAFLTQYTPAGALVFSTYYGGSLDDSAKAVAVTSDGYVYIAGGTFSTDLTLKSPLQSGNAGGQDGFVAGFGKQGAGLQYATYFGGSAGSPGEPEFISAIALDASRQIYIAGITSSYNLRATNALWPASRGGLDGFVAKLAAGGGQLFYSTYLGGTSADFVTGLAVDSLGDAYVCGYTWSPDFPSKDTISSRSADYDAFVSEIDSTGHTYVLGVFLAGSASDAANALALGPSGSIYVAGQTLSGDFPRMNSIGSPVSGLQGTLSVLSVDSSPTAVSVSPASGSGYRQQFTITTSSPMGASHLARTFFSLGSANGPWCYAVFVAPDSIYLFDYAQNTFLPLSLGSASTAETGACRVYAANSSVTNAGMIQTLAIDLYLKPAFGGAKTIAVQAQDDAGRYSTFPTMATWTVTIDPNSSSPIPLSMTPSSGTGLSNQFVFTSYDPAGATDLFRTFVQFSAAGSPAMCYIVYVAGGLYLLNDRGTAFLPGVALGANISVQNSYCTINAAGSSVSSSGTTQILTISITFTTAFTGEQTVTTMVQTNGGEQSVARALGSWTVPAAAGTVLTPVSVSPSSGAGTTQSFVFTSTDPAGAYDILRTYAMFTAAGSTAMCYVVLVSSSTLYLLDDSGATFLPLLPGANASVENNSCRINGLISSVSNYGATQTLTLNITFKPAFAGPKTISAQVQTVANSIAGTKTLGTWTAQ
jgi:hypothetical protein